GGDFVIAVAFAEAEIEPATRREIQGRGLLGQEHWVVPRQNDDRRAEPQCPCARAQPGQQIDCRRNLPIAGEMVLHDKGAAKAERLGLDIVVDEVAKPLAAVELGGLAGIGAPRRRAAEQTELHTPCSVTWVLWVRLSAIGRCGKEPSPALRERVGASGRERLGEGFRIKHPHPARRPGSPPSPAVRERVWDRNYACDWYSGPRMICPGSASVTAPPSAMIVPLTTT